MSELTNHQKSAETHRQRGDQQRVHGTGESLSSPRLEDYIRTISEINQTFYKQQADSFSQTRTYGWPGWDLLYPNLVSLHESSDTQPLAILDLACGNLRFERYLAQKNPSLSLEIYACDSCSELLRYGAEEFQALGQTGHTPHEDQPQPSHVPFSLNAFEFDLMQSLIASFTAHTQRSDDKSTPVVLSPQTTTWLPEISPLKRNTPLLTCCFGFMHHIPTYALRIHALLSLCYTLPQGSLIALSFWEFLNDETRAYKAQQAHKQARERGILSSRHLPFLEPSDYFLGWSDAAQAARFCHAFSPQELDRIIADLSGKACVIDRYHADGKTQNLNEYLILQTLP